MEPLNAPWNLTLHWLGWLMFLLGCLPLLVLLVIVASAFLQVYFVHGRHRHSAG